MFIQMSKSVQSCNILLRGIGLIWKQVLILNRRKFGHQSTKFLLERDLYVAGKSKSVSDKSISNKSISHEFTANPRQIQDASIRTQ